jgi:alkylation response protein AidB-like acyl-CoA dehydrogenase
MDFRLTPEQLALRDEVRAFLDAEAPEPHPEAHIVPEEGTDEEWEFGLEMTRKLSKRGWYTAHWPVEWGGSTLGPVELGILWEEIAYRGVLSANVIGQMMAQLFIQFGTEEQKREHLPAIATCENIWAEGYSEPDAGSDLASLRTTAIRDGDEYVVNGTKIWTGQAHRSNWMFIFARTDPNAPKHRGISYIISPIDAPGIKIIPIPTLAGTVCINQEFFEDVRVPIANVVGHENSGWQHRRELGGRGPGGTGPNEPAVARRHQEQLVAYCREKQPGHGRLADDPTVRHRLAELAIENQVLRWLHFRTLSERASGGRNAAAGEIVGIWRREHMQKTARLGVSILGLRGQLMPGSGEWAPMMSWFARQYLYSVPASIYGGTVEIHRDLVARALGMPR